VASLPFLTFELGPLVLIGAACVAAAGAWLLARLAGVLRNRLGVAAIGLFAPIIAYGIWNPVITTQRSVYPSGWSSPESVARRLGIGTVGYDLNRYDVIGLYATQWFLPHTREVLFDGRTQRPPAQFVLSGMDWAREHPNTHAEAIWHDLGRDEVLWRLQSDS
jgi:hypothetical protein